MMILISLTNLKYTNQKKRLLTYITCKTSNLIPQKLHHRAGKTPQCPANIFEFIISHFQSNNSIKVFNKIQSPTTKSIFAKLQLKRFIYPWLKSLSGDFDNQFPSVKILKIELHFKLKRSMQFVSGFPNFIVRQDMFETGLQNVVC